MHDVGVLRDAFVGGLMRAYRKSPLYPTWGHRFARVLARMPGSDRQVVKEIDGVTFELDLNEVIDSSLYYSGTFEVATEKAISSRLAEGMTAVDIGANVGYHTFRMARAVGPTGSVLAVEPMSRARTKLLRNAGLNSFTNITVSEVALADADLGIQSIGFENSYRLDGEVGAAAEDVRITTLDTLVAEAGLSRVDFIKLDVDGYEGKVLRGAQHVLDTWRPAIVFEISPGAMAGNGDRAEDLVASLTGRGYVLRYEDGSTIEDLAALLANVGDYSVNLVAEVPQRAG